MNYKYILLEVYFFVENIVHKVERSVCFYHRVYRWRRDVVQIWRDIERPEGGYSDGVLQQQLWNCVRRSLGRERC